MRFSAKRGIAIVKLVILSVRLSVITFVHCD